MMLNARPAHEAGKGHRKCLLDGLNSPPAI